MVFISYIFFTMISIVIADILVLPYDGRFIEEEFRDIPASFGNGLPVEGLHGMLVNAQPADACSPVQKPPPLEENRTGKWVLLVKRYNCSFEAKVRMAQASLYDAVIVHNVGSDALEPMSANNTTQIHIPSVFVSESSGMIMKQVYADNEEYFIVINSEVPFNINTHLLLPFAVVVGICFLVMIIFMVAKCIRDRRRQHRHRLPWSTLNKIPTCKYQKGDPYETCVICLDEFIDGEKLRVLPCAHTYHTKCIDPWLTKNRRVCPVCKRKVFAHDETPYNDSDSDSDADDRTPLLTAGGRTTATSQHGTFVDTDASATRIMQLAGLSISQQSELVTAIFATASDQFSINGEQSDASSLISSTSESNSEVETRPGTSNPNQDIIV